MIDDESHLVSKKQNTAHVIFIMIKGMEIRAGQVDRTIFGVTIFYLMCCWDKVDIVHHFHGFKRFRVKIRRILTPPTQFYKEYLLNRFPR